MKIKVIKKADQLLLGTWCCGPLTLRDIDFQKDRISANAILYGVPLGKVVITAQSPIAKVGGNVGFARAEVLLLADFDSGELDYHVNVQAFGHSIYADRGRFAEDLSSPGDTIK